MKLIDTLLFVFLFSSQDSVLSLTKDQNFDFFSSSRYYDPKVGRFTQPDSVIPTAIEPISWNRYAYTKNNPLKYIDPSGHIPKVRKNSQDPIADINTPLNFQEGNSGKLRTPVRMPKIMRPKNLDFNDSISSRRFDPTRPITMSNIAVVEDTVYGAGLQVADAIQDIIGDQAIVVARYVANDSLHVYSPAQDGSSRQRMKKAGYWLLGYQLNPNANNQSVSAELWREEIKPTFDATQNKNTSGFYPISIFTTHYSAYKDVGAGYKNPDQIIFSVPLIRDLEVIGQDGHPMRYPNQLILAHELFLHAGRTIRSGQIASHKTVAQEKAGQVDWITKLENELLIPAWNENNPLDQVGLRSEKYHVNTIEASGPPKKED